MLGVAAVERAVVSAQAGVMVFDVFMSYRHSDIAMVRTLVVALERRGLRVWFDATRVPAFGGITDSARHGLGQSKALVAFYSAEYPDSSPCQWELTLAFLAAQRLGDPRRRVLVVNPESGPEHVEPVELRDALYQSVAEGDNERIDEVASAVASHVKGLAGGLASGVAAPMLWLPSQPLAAPRFVGRRREMWRIHSALHASHMGMTQGVVGPGVVQVRGLGGIGKSLLAREYSLRYSGAFPGGVFWLHVGSEEATDATQTREASRLEQMRSFAVSVLGPEGARVLERMPPEDVETVLRNALATGDACLWVVDDLPPGLESDEVHRWLGPASAKTLVTTRSREYSALMPEVSVGMLETGDALELLTGRHAPANDEELACAFDIVEELGGHALALDVAGAALRFQSFTDLLTRLRDPHDDELELAAELREALPSGHARSISATLAQSFERLDEAGRDVLRIGSLLASDPVPASLLATVIVEAGQVAEAPARRQAVHTLDQVHALSLIESPEHGLWQIHPLVGRTSQLLEDDPKRVVALKQAAVAAVTKQFADAEQFEALRPIVSHARRLCIPPDTAEVARLLGLVAEFDYEVGDYPTAHVGLATAEKLLCEWHGPTDLATLGAKDSHARTLRELGDLQGARALGEEVLAAMREKVGAEHPFALQAMGNLTVTLRMLGDLQSARTLGEEALAKKRELLGPRHPDTLKAMANLAVTLDMVGELGTACALCEEALVAQRELLGPTHPDTVGTMSNLANMRYGVGDLMGARQLCEEALAEQRELVGPNHPLTLQTMGNLASMLSAVGDGRGARVLEEEVLETQRELLGVNHPSTLQTMSNLAATLNQLGDLKGARILGEEALTLQRERLGINHPLTLQTMVNLASTLGMLDDLKGASALADKALAIQRELFGSKHPTTLSTQVNLANTLRAMGDLRRARALETEALSAQRALLGPSHPSTLLTMRNLVKTLDALGDTRSARLLEEEEARLRGTEAGS